MKRTFGPTSLLVGWETREGEDGLQVTQSGSNSTEPRTWPAGLAFSLLSGAQAAALPGVRPQGTLWVEKELHYPNNWWEPHWVFL